VRTVAIVNQKGGCGKTTTAINLGASLGRAGLRTLLIDLDPQGHCAAGLGVPECRIELDSSDLLQSAGTRPLELSRLLWRASRNLDLIPSRIRLAGLEAPSSAFARLDERERALARSLARLSDRFDVCLLDCPPSIGLLTFNALVAADLVLVPVETGYFSLQGAARQLTTVRAIGRRLGTEIRCAVVPTLHEPGLAVAEDLLRELERRFGKRLLPVTIHRDAALREAASFGLPVCEHAPGSQGARDYAALASLLIESEHLLTVAPDEDWQDIDALDPSPISRPARADQPGPLHPGARSCDPIGPVEPARVCVHAPSFGEIVVTYSSGELCTGLARRLGDEPAKPGAGRASRVEDIARRAASLRAPLEPGAPPVAAAAAKRVLGAQLGAAGVVFTQPGALGKCVAVAGDFSAWQPLPMTHNAESNVHELTIRLSAGRHEYRLVVDGHWIADPYNTEWVLNEFGEPHSIIEVPASEAPSRECDARCGAD